MEMLILYQLLICFVLTIPNVKSQAVDELCLHQKTSVTAVCKLLVQCPSAIKDLLSGIFPQKCGFQGAEVIVCCIEDPTVETTTTANPISRVVGEKSEQACKSFERLAYRETSVPTLESANDAIEDTICPWSQGNLALIGNEKAREAEFPHMALIGYGEPEKIMWQCSGTLLSDRFILTAAHCLFTRAESPKLVRLGEHNYTNPRDDQHVQQINIAKLHKHPDYKFALGYNDIALLELETPAMLNIYVKPACLYTKDPVDVPRGIISGWGTTESGEENDFLSKAVVDVFPPRLCNKTYKPGRIIPNGIDPSIQICYGSNSTREESCQDFSGGPLQIYNENQHCSYSVFGVISFGLSCRIKGIPAVYVNVYAYTDWIEKIVWP